MAASRVGSTLVVLHLRGLDRDAAGQRFGAHVHVGPCVPGVGAAAGPHDDDDVATGVSDDALLHDDEVSLDFTVRPGGTASAVTRVPFTIASGDAQSVVVHALPTDDAGMAGGPLACLPVDF